MKKNFFWNPSSRPANRPADPPSIPRPWAWGLAIAAVAVIAWTSWGHHSYFLYGDEAINFQQHIGLGKDYFRKNMEAWSHAAGPDGGASVEHVTLLEGGFPVFLYLVSHLGERAPFVANAVLLPVMLVLLAGCVWMTEAGAHRRLIAALFGIALLLSFPASSMPVWALAHPFRDTVSHVLGLGGLMVLYRASRIPERAAMRAFWGGVLIGLSGWSRLPGFLFVVPAAAILISFAEFGPWKKKVLLLMWLGGGVFLGVVLLAAQNVFEGRSAWMPPQADKLLMTGDPKPGAGDGIRTGWHPLNLRYLLLPVMQNIYRTFPAWLNLVILAGLAGWIVTSRKRAIRLLPLVAGLAVFAAFYGCYCRVILRYLVIAVMFYSAVAGVALAWMADGLLRGAHRLRLGPHAFWQTAAGAALVLVIATAAVKSGPDGTRVRDEWRDARSFRDWLRANVPDRAAIHSKDHSLETWIRYFGEHRVMWHPALIRGDAIDGSQATLPDTPAFVLVRYTGTPERISTGWMHDALLNRFELEPHAPPLQSIRFPQEGVRLFSAKERHLRERTLEIASSPPGAHVLYVFLRAMDPGRPAQDVTLYRDSWPREWPARIQAGANLIVMPDDLDLSPGPMTMRSAEPLPSVLEAFGMGAQPVGMNLNETKTIASRLLQVEGTSLYWSGYRWWKRDWGAHSPRHASRPMVVLGESSRMRLPGVSGSLGSPIRMRLYYSLISDDSKLLEHGYRMRYQVGGRPVSPEMTICNASYKFKIYQAADFMQELDINVERAAAQNIQWIEWLAIPADPALKPLDVYLHRIEYFLGDGSDGSLQTAKRFKRTSWLQSGFAVPKEIKD